MRLIDLRSDTVTQPTDEMRRVMVRAEVGDDVYGEDPTINLLEQTLAARLGKEAALFVPSGTMSNLLGVTSHCQRGEAVLLGDHAHIYSYEAGGCAILGSVLLKPLPMQADGSISLEDFASGIMPDDPHFAPVTLLAIENTHSGKVLPIDYLQRLRHFADQRGLPIHMDGARLFNAAVDLGVEVEALARYADSVSICLSKGLGAPVGSCLVGTKALIAKARRMRKMLGGGMRQAGILAQAGLYALEHHVARLADDHRRARRLAEGLAALPGVKIDLSEVQTNMLFIEVPELDSTKLVAFLREHGILCSAGKKMRLVTHIQISDDDVEEVIDAFAEYIQQQGQK